MTRVALAILDSPMLAEEIVQEAYLRFLVTEPGLVENPSAWLATVTRNLALDQARRTLRERELLQLLPGWDCAGLYDDRHADVSQLAGIVACLIHVSSSQVTAILLLHIVFGMSYEDIAAISGRSSVACRQAGRRALRKCAAAIHADETCDEAAETAETDMYVHAILHATMAPLIDSLNVASPPLMQSCGVAKLSEELIEELIEEKIIECSNYLPSTACRTRQVLVLTDNGVQWALVLGGVVLCHFENAVIPPAAAPVVELESCL